MVKICVVGSISTDFVVESDRWPQVGETIFGQNSKRLFGGKGANQAVAAARLGAEVLMAGCVGQDPLAQDLIDNLQDEGIDISQIKRMSAVPSGAAHITLVEGENAIIYVPGANDHFLAEDVAKLGKTLSEVDIVLVQNESPLATVESLVDQCHQLNLPLIWNPAPARPLASEYLDKLNYLTPNESEFKALFPDQDFEETLAQYPNKLIVTLGAQGAIYHDGQDVRRVSGMRVDQVVDTTGAGDTFNGALAVALASGKTLGEAIYFANRAAGLSVQKEGAQGGCPTLEEMGEDK